VALQVATYRCDVPIINASCERSGSNMKRKHFSEIEYPPKY